MGNDHVKNHLMALFYGIFTAVAVFVIFLAMLALGSCSSPRKVSSSTESRSVADMVDRLDSLMSLKTVVRQDSAWRESVMRQFQSILEKSDTSRSVTLSAAGDTIRERIVINNVRETTSETDRREREVLMRRIESMDSTIGLMRLQISHSDSLLQASRTTVEVPDRLTWWQQARLHLANILLYALLILGVYMAIRAKFPKK